MCLVNGRLPCTKRRVVLGRVDADAVARRDRHADALAVVERSAAARAARCFSSGAGGERARARAASRAGTRRRRGASAPAAESRRRARRSGSRCARSRARGRARRAPPSPRWGSASSVVRVVNGVASVAMEHSRSLSSASTSRSRSAGSISGSSPWTLTTSRFWPRRGSVRATSATRSVPLEVARRGQHDLGAEAPRRVDDARVVGRDDHAADAVRLADALPDVLEEELAGLVQERLLGQARRAEARRDDGDRLHGALSRLRLRLQLFAVRLVEALLHLEEEVAGRLLRLGRRSTIALKSSVTERAICV